jgi:alkylmercury lyase
MPDIAPTLESTITCPHCGHRAAETMPSDACQFFYDCQACGALLKPKPGDCCVFCSYGTVPCPPVQAGKNAPACCAQDAVAVEIRPGVQRPDWSVVTSSAAKEALLARGRRGPVEAWNATLPPDQDAVWRATIALFARLGRSPRWREIAAATKLGAHAVEAILLELEGYDLLASDKKARAISYAYPFTALGSTHRVKIHGHTLHALCAIDALGVGAMCDTDIAIESACRLCGTVISIETAQQGAALRSAQPNNAVVWYDLAYDGRTARSCCPSIAFFCSDAHLESWLTVQNRAPVGRQLTLAEALEVGRALFQPVLRGPHAVGAGNRASSRSRSDGLG